jgi:hypothetical protein
LDARQQDYRRLAGQSGNCWRRVGGGGGAGGAEEDEAAAAAALVPVPRATAAANARLFRSGLAHASVLLAPAAEAAAAAEGDGDGDGDGGGGEGGASGCFKASAVVVVAPVGGALCAAQQRVLGGIRVSERNAVCACAYALLCC